MATYRAGSGMGGGESEMPREEELLWQKARLPPCSVTVGDRGLEVPHAESEGKSRSCTCDYP